jgi:hypothetical protein
MEGYLFLDFFSRQVLFCFWVPGSMLSCFSAFSAFSASLLFCFSAFLLFAFPASLLFLLLCFSALLFCLLLILFLFFSASLFSLLLCFCTSGPFYLVLSTSTILLFLFLQSCDFAALLPAP